MKKLVLAGVGVGFILLSIFNWKAEVNHEEFNEQMKVVVREIGNQTLLENGDSTSLVLPVLKIEKDLYQLAFQNELSIVPEIIPDIIKSTFKKGNIIEAYRVQILQCKTDEVAYSYQVGGKLLESIIPCRGRNLPKACYKIQLRLLANPKNVTSNLGIICLVIGLMFISLLFIIKEKRQVQKEEAIEKQEPESLSYTSIGSFQFYPDQNKLIKQPTEISLSRKECELLQILAQNPNRIVKRDELTKRVWEDHGVIVGRSLDTYISKLRKKLKEDTTIKITNVHGVGYKLEILD